MKKGIVPILSTVLLFCFSLSSFAYTQDELDGANFMAENSYIVDYSSSPEKFRLNDSITRKEVMKIIAKIAGADVENNICKGEFSDVKSDDWGCKYIEWGIDKVIAKNAMFRPDEKISKSEALKMILKVKGIEKTVDSGVWQKDYVETAYEKGWYEDKWTDYTTAATRGWIFLSVNRIVNNIKVGAVDDTESILDELFDLLK